MRDEVWERGRADGRRSPWQGAQEANAEPGASKGVSLARGFTSLLFPLKKDARTRVLWRGSSHRAKTQGRRGAGFLERYHSLLSETRFRTP